MTGDRGRQDRDHAKALSKGQRGHDGGLLNADNGQGGLIAQRMQARIAKAGNHIARSIRLCRRKVQHWRNRQIGLSLALDARRPFGQRQTADRGAEFAQGIKRKFDPIRHGLR